MRSPHGIDTPQNVARSVGALVAFAVLIGLGILLISSSSANLIIGYAIIVGFLAVVAYAWIADAIKTRRDS